MELEDIRELVDSADQTTSASREEASDMLIFGRISQWDDSVAQDAQTEFRGTFDIIKARRNRILGELWSNPVDVRFKPKDGAEDDAAETLTGMYRTDTLAGDESINTAVQDQIDAGYGAFRFVTTYESKFDDLNNNQVIRLEPINEANNVLYWDDNAKRKDKSDARWAMLLTSFTQKGWEQYCEENGIDWEEGVKPASFEEKHSSTSFVWGTSKDEIKIGEFYHKTRKREIVCIYQDPVGQTKAYYKTKIKDVLPDLEAAGYVKIGEKKKDRWIVTKYLVSGEEIVKKQRIAGEQIPIVPVYGDWSIVEGREIWRGIYHDAQDPQRLHNFLMSYTADIVAKGPRQKPIFYPGQIQGFEYMYTLSGADNNYPYMLQNEKSPETDQPYPIGPVGYIENPQMPQAGAALMEMTRRSVDDVTGGSLNSDQMLSSQVTEGQIQATQNAQNMETFLYQNSLRLAMKQAGRIYASMAAELYDVPRDVTVTQPDGTESTVTVMESVLDYETGEEVVLNDITRGTFEVFADVGPSYQTQKDEARAELREMYQGLPEGSPVKEFVMLKYVSLLDGPKMDTLREWARKQLILKGFEEPDTDEEKQMVAQAQQAAQEPDANMLLAMAEMEKAKADQADAQNDQAKVQVSAYEAETKRLKALAEAQKTKADTLKTGYEIKGTELDNVQKMLQAMTPASQRVQ